MSGTLNRILDEYRNIEVIRDRISPGIIGISSLVIGTILLYGFYIRVNKKQIPADFYTNIPIKYGIDAGGVYRDAIGRPMKRDYENATGWFVDYDLLVKELQAGAKYGYGDVFKAYLSIGRRSVLNSVRRILN